MLGQVLFVAALVIVVFSMVLGVFNVMANPEVCNGLDDDGDGQIDEGFTYIGIVTGDPCDGIGECGIGTVYCINLTIAECSTNPGGPNYDGITETCDGKDNNCNSHIDEDFTYMGNSVNDPCDGIGECGIGTVYCINGSTAGCSTNSDGLNYDGRFELCDYKDNDCDGLYDEDFKCHGVPTGDPCDGIGECGIGTAYCINETETYCSTDPGGPDYDGTAEKCDSKDNDCDNATDEDFNVGEACSVGLGECVNTGGMVCSADGTGTVCGVVPLEPTAETCDSKDNDCDNATDEDFDLTSDLSNCGSCGNVCSFPNSVAACNIGLCKVSACNAGFWDIDGLSSNGCEYQCDKTSNSDELCDGLDNDCDGLIDEDVDKNTDVNNCGSCGNACSFPNANAACAGGACVLASCKTGFTDTNGNPSDGCENSCTKTANTDTSCDGVDNDCDGQIDEDFVQATCSAGVGECARTGNLVCGNGTSSCNAVAGPPSAEVCDGKDNDCDGTVDEGTSCDADGDGVIDSKDSCKLTPPGTAVDKSGCSAGQFCSLVSIPNRGWDMARGIIRCLMADWKSNDFWIPNDCRIVQEEKGSGKSKETKFTCVARKDAN